MQINIWLKILFFFVVCAVVLYLGFIAFFVTALMGLVKFYTPLVVVVTIGILIFAFIGIFQLLRPKVFKTTLIGFIAVCSLAVIIYESVHAYHNSFETVDAEVDLYEYMPFQNYTKVVTLDEQATLKLDRDLPILDGATALYPVYSAFVQAVYPEKEYNLYDSELMVNTTPEAYNNLIEGKVDIIFVAGPSERQLNYAKSKGIELELTPIGKEAFVFFVNGKNPVQGLTVEQIQAIYAGDITNWQEVGGGDEAIRAFQRPPDSGSQTALEKLMGDKRLMDAPTEDVVAGMGGIIQQTSNYRNYKNAIGYSFRYFSMEMVQNNAIHHLEIDGVFPDKETIRSGTYPLTSELYAVTAGSDNPNVERLIQWILSAQGQSIIEQTGYVSVHEKQ